MLDDGFYIVHRGEDVLARAFDDLQADRRFAIELCIGLLVFECPANVSDICERNDGISGLTDREAERVFSGFYQPWDFDGETT